MKTQPWIKTSDLLPEDGQEVFFYRALGSGDVMRGTFARNPEPRFDRYEGLAYYVDTEHVTHWMPSPTPAAPIEA